MSKQKQQLSQTDKQDIAKYLLDKGVTQKNIAQAVDASQSWVSQQKQLNDTAKKAYEAGQQDIKNAIVNETIKQASNKLVENTLKDKALNTGLIQLQ